MSKILIVEDEFSIALDLETSLHQMGFEVMGIIDSFEQCKEFLSSQKPDAILMDIRLKGDISGIETAKWINNHHSVPIVFLTALSDENTLESILETESYGYLTKPFKEKDLLSTLKIAIKNFHLLNEARKLAFDAHFDYSKLNYDDHIFIKEKNKLVSIAIDTISFFEALENYTQIVSENKKWIINGFLKEIEAKLPQQFMRVHRSYVVNLNKIEKIEDNIIIIHQNSIPIGRSYKNELFKKIKIL